MMRKSVVLVFAVAAFAAPVLAGSPPVRTVAYADLNLATADGKSALDRRILRAARSICAVSPVVETQSVADERARCEKETISATRTQVAALVSASTRFATLQ